MLRRQSFQVSGVNVVCMPVPREICYPSVSLLYLLSLSSWWFDGFPSRFKVSLFEADDDTADLPRNGTVRCLAVSTHSLGPLHSRGGGGGRRGY